MKTMLNFKKPNMNSDWSLLHCRWQEQRWCQGESQEEESTVDPTEEDTTLSQRNGEKEEAAEGIGGCGGHQLPCLQESQLAWQWR